MSPGGPLAILVEMSQQQASGQRIDPRRIRRTVVRSAPLVLVASVLLLWWCFGVVKVPPGMDGVRSIPPGSVCLIDKRQGSLRVGSSAFVDLPDGGTVLSRVQDLTADGMMLLGNDDPQSTSPDSSDFGALPTACLRGVVLVVFAGEGAPGEVIRER